MIKKILIPKLLLPKRSALLEQKKELYSNKSSSEDITDFQLKEFNKVWEGAVKNFIFYKDLKDAFSLPERIGSLEELQGFPTLTKEMLSENERIISDDLQQYRKIQYVRTGGTSGSTTRFPTNSEQRNYEYANTYLGKSWHQIAPFDRIIHIWGHSHLFGSGFKGRINEIKRFIVNKIIQTKRLNAYQLDISTVNSYIKEIVRYKPKIIIGYTSSLFIISKYITDNKINVQFSNLSRIILTTESASKEDIQLIQQAFNVQVILEYGMAETGVIAYSSESMDKCKVLWDSFVCIEDTKELILTTIYQRCFPLINYGTGDKLIKTVKFNSSIIEFENIDGRKQDIFHVFSDDFLKQIPISAVMIVHMLKEWPGVLSIASKQANPGIIEVHIYGQDLDLDSIKAFLLKKIRSELGKISSESIILISAKSINRSLAGKHSSIIS